MNTEIPKSKVYVLLDERSRVIRCEGGYTMSNIDDASKWTYIDEGTGDRYNLCQSHYLDGGLYTMQGIPRYKYEDGVCVLRSEAEIAEDVANLPPPAPVEPTSAEAVQYKAALKILGIETEG
uniref:Uncharacterized protein n=1 Tax=Siphoviridae sp. ct2kB26 TaxID=2825317 RepID=A0A8S5PA03_9CAUD|nr:MAG TPA: hypothetical protein [Siphoviridae sp. ct2kB26]